MTPIDSFSLQSHTGPVDNWPLESVLFFNSAELPIKVPGYAIDRQYKLDSYYLLFNNFDCPFEESCEIVVISDQLKRVACRSLGGMYSSFMLESVEYLAVNNFRLKFHGDFYYRLTVNHPLRFGCWPWRKLVLRPEAVSTSLQG